MHLDYENGCLIPANVLLPDWMLLRNFANLLVLHKVAMVPLITHMVMMRVACNSSASTLITLSLTKFV